MNCRLQCIMITIAVLAFGACHSSDTLPPTANQTKFRISGRIIGQDGIDVSGIEINTGTFTAITDSDGRYLITNLPNSTYMLTPQRHDLAFTPASIAVQVNGQDVTSQNFIATKSPSDDSLSKNMLAIAGGSFLMGSNSDDQEERPVHMVTVATFAMSKYEVTQKQWQDAMGSNPSQFAGNEQPVERVSWYDAIAYCNTLSLMEGLNPTYTVAGDNTTCNFNANGYRLPTEAEWEYACRAGTTTDYYSGDRTGSLSGCYAEPALALVGWYCNNSNGTTHPVGQKQPNEFGLFDMHGNVFEWCWDWRGNYPTASQTNPTGATTGSIRICRGGSWFYVPQQSRSAFRLAYLPNSKYSGVGFRVVRTIH